MGKVLLLIPSEIVSNLMCLCELMDADVRRQRDFKTTPLENKCICDDLISSG